MKKVLKNIILLLCMILVFSCISSCSNENLLSANEESDILDEETEEQFIPEDIDVSDVFDSISKTALLKIDELNHSVGEMVYVTKEDYLEYRDYKVSLIGDSISDYSKPYLRKCLRRIFQDSVSGREMEKGIEAFDNMKEIGRIGDIMILSLGNNAPRGIEIEVLEHIYEGMEGKPLIIPTIIMPYAGQERNRNRDLINFVNTHEGCYIADWNKLARANPSFISEDGVHPTGEGSAGYAQLMLKTVIDIDKRVID